MELSRQRDHTVYGPLDGWSTLQVQLLQTLALDFLVLDIRSNHCFIPAHHRNKVAACPKMLTSIIVLAFIADPRQMDGALALECDICTPIWSGLGDQNYPSGFSSIVCLATHAAECFR